MAQQVKNNTLGFLNKDDEPRLLPKGDYRDALNVRRQVSSNGVPTPIKNILGNNRVNNSSLSSGDNVVIGSTVIQELNNIYYFVWNSLGSHAIYQYNVVNDIITLVVEDEFLNFQKNNYITGANAVTNLDGDVLLYWTDNFNPPRKINVKRAILHNEGNFSDGYGSDFSNGTDAQKAVYYDAVKHPPLNPPTFSFSIDNSVSTNNIAGKVFQFRYRYIYDDGERSAYSPWSKLAISDKERLNNSIDANSYDTEYNNILVNFEPSSQNNVERIELTFREGNNGDERLWTDLKNNPATNAEFFYNNSVSTLVNTQDSIKLFDAVPLLVKSQEVKDNVLFYANTVDGFNLPSINQNTRVVPQYSPLVREDFKTIIPVSKVATNSIEIDLSGFTVSVGSYFFVDFYIKGESSNLFPNTFIRQISGDYTANQGDSISDVLNELVNQFNTSIINNGVFLITFNAFVSGGKIIINVVENSLSGGYNISAINSESFSTENPIQAVLTHKSGAYHPYGVVYYDRANRSSSVMKIDNTYVPFPTERDKGFSHLGVVGMNVFLNHTPPSWATHYQIVYGGNTSVDEYLQYTCSDVYKGKDIVTSNNFDRLYLSLKNFKGGENSWKESTGAIPDYNFVEGDRLRIINYYDPSRSSRVDPNTYLDFKVVGLEVLSNNSADNPIITTADNTTALRDKKSGLFLILEDPKVDGFDIDSGSNRSTGFWYNSSAEQGAYFEIYRPKELTDDIPYYEVGEKYDVLNAGLSNRKHDGGIRSQNSSATYTLSSATVNTVTTLDSATDIIVGDTVNITDSSDNVILSTVVERIDVSQISNIIYISDSLETPSVANKIVLTETSAVTTVIGGDSWFKPRTFFTGESPSFNSSPVFIEDYYANDFIKSSNSWDKGRPHAFSPLARRVRRKATVWYSEPFFPQDDNYNGFSAFNLSLTPYRDYDQSYGGIQVMKQNNEGIILWQEDKVSKILVDRNVIESAEGQGTLTTNQDKLGIQVFYRGDYGIAQQPESLNGFDGVWYFMDLKRGKYIRLSNDGITPISDYKMRNYFYNTSKGYIESYAQTRIIGGYDSRNKESIISFPTLLTSSVTTSSGDMIGGLPNSSADDTNLTIGVDVGVGNPDKVTFGNESRIFGEISETFGSWGGNKYSTYDIAEKGSVDITQGQSEILGNSALDVYVEFNTTSGNFLVPSTLDANKGEIQTPITNANYINLTVTTTTTQDAFTLAFYEPANRWSTFYSFIPEYMANINSLFFTFKNGDMYKHEATGSPYNSFYGVTYPSAFTPVVNDAPFDVKAFYAVMIDGTTQLNITASTNLNGTTMSGDNFVLREGRYYGQFPFATTSSGDSAILAVGEVDSKQTNNLTIEGDISHSGIFVGDTLHDNNGNTSTIQSINGNVLTIAPSGGFGSGDFVFVVRNNFIDGDRLRGNYIELACTMTTANQNKEQEVYSIDVEASKSYY